MAITFRLEAQNFDPVCNPIEWTFETDNGSQPNFSFIVELYIDAALHSTHEVYRESGDVAKFNAQSVLRAAIVNNQFTRTDLDVDTLVNYDVYIKVYEKDGTPPVTDLGSV